MMPALLISMLAGCVHVVKPQTAVPDAAEPWLVEVRASAFGWSPRRAEARAESGFTKDGGASIGSEEVLHRTVRTSCWWSIATVATLAIVAPCRVTETGLTLDERLPSALKRLGKLPETSGVGRPRWVWIDEDLSALGVLQTVHGVPLIGAELLIVDRSLSDVRTDLVIHDYQLPRPPDAPDPFIAYVVDDGAEPKLLPIRLEAAPAIP